MKSFTGNSSSARGWALLLALLLGPGMMISACGDEETPAPTTPEPTPAPPPAPPPAPDPTGPATPENLRVSGSTSTSITWMWDAVEGALGYQGQFSPDATFADTDPTFIIVAPNTSHTVSNLSGNMTGHFRVRSGTGTSLTDLTYSDWTEGVSGSTAAPPPAQALGAPDGLRATNREDEAITLEWNEVDDAATYEVQQQADGASGWSEASCGGADGVVGGTECVASGLEVATEYNFRVRAVPASSDTDRFTESDWTETTASVSTTGTRTPETSSMGEGDLNVTWESETTEITWEWELTDNRDHVYQLMVLTDAQADVEDSTPCPRPTASVAGVSWDTGSVDRRRHTVDSGVAAGDVRLLCLQTMWEDENGVSQYGNMSWAWAAATPTAPTGGSPDEDNGGKTSEITWGTVGLDPGFKYVFTLVSGSVEDGEVAGTQGACKAGSSLGTETTDVALTLSAYSVNNPAVFTSNRLCYRAESSSGASEWAIGNAVTTLPAAPNRPRADDSSLASDETAIKWTVADKDGVPRGHERGGATTGYNTFVITDEDPASRTPPNAARHCTDGLDTDNKFSHAALSGSISLTQDGIELSHSVSANSDTVNPRVYHLCIQAKLDSSRAGPWVVGGSVTQAKQPS